jgi:phage protein D
MATIEHAAKPRITLGGSPLPADIDVLVEEVVVEDHLHVPDSFILRFRDPERDVLKRSGVSIGSQVTISATAVGVASEELLMVGEVTALEAEFDTSGSHAVVRGYDHSHRLQRGKRTQTYHQMTDADIAHKIAARAGIPAGTISATKTVHEHVSQVNITDWEFLKARAREIGYEAAVRSGKLDFSEPVESAGAPDTGDLTSVDPLQMALGAELEVFRPRITSAQQVKHVEVRGWDPIRKEAVVGKAASRTTSVSLATTADGVAANFGEPATHVAGGRPIASQLEADVAAAALAEQLASAFAEAAGIAKGNPRLKAGTPVSIALVGEPFEGRYTLTTTKHVYDAGGYKTHFMVSGRHDRSILGLVAGAGASSSANGRMFGVDVGIVADVRDPEALGRVKILLPTQDSEYVSHWARLVQPGAGKRRGAVVLPEVGDEVLVVFGQGDVRNPYVLGGLYNGVDRPDLGDRLIDDATGAVRRRGFISKKGHKIVFLDDDAQSGVMLSTGDDGLRIALKETGTTIRINSNGKVEIEAAADVTIKAGAQLNLSGAAGVNIESGGTVSVTGSAIRLN